MTMSSKQANHLSYLLRLWQDNDEARPVWRASLQSELAGERQGFASLDELFAFLRRQVEMDPDTDQDGLEERQQGRRKPPSVI